MKKLILIILVFYFSVAEIYSQDFSKMKDAKPIKLSGSLSVGSFLYNVNGIDSRQSPYGYSLGANLNLSLYGVNVPLYASFNEQGGAFSHPFNRFGMSPQYKWIKAHFGWRSMNMSQFTLSNNTFLGAGIDLTPGKFRFSAMKGKLREPAALENINFYIPQFERDAYAFKIGYGSSKRYFDLILFKAKDDTSSLELPDSTLSNIDAHENLVLGVKNQLTFLKNKLKFTLDASVSAFSHNIRYNDIEIPNEKYDWFSKLYTPSISSSINYAGESSLSYSHENFTIAAKYRRVMPEFKTLGSEYLLNDVEAITINPSLVLFKGKLIFGGSFGRQRNNLDNNRLSTNERFISSVNMNINPKPHYGFMVAYSNYSFQQQIIIDSIYSNSMVVNQLNHNLNFTPRLMIDKEKHTHNIILTNNFQILQDRNINSDASNNMFLSNLIYSLRFKESKISLRSGINYFNFKSNNMNINRFGLSIGGMTKVFKEKISINSNLSYNTQRQSFSNSNFLIFNLGINYKIYKKSKLGLQFYFNNVNSDIRRFAEERVQLNFSQSF